MVSVSQGDGGDHFLIGVFSFRTTPQAVLSLGLLDGVAVKSLIVGMYDRSFSAHISSLLWYNGGGWRLMAASSKPLVSLALWHFGVGVCRLLA